MDRNIAGAYSATGRISVAGPEVELIALSARAVVVDIDAETDRWLVLSWFGRAAEVGVVSAESGRQKSFGVNIEASCRIPVVKLMMALFCGLLF